MTTDFRRVLSEAVAKHLGNSQLEQVFPGFGNQSEKFLQIIGS